MNIVEGHISSLAFGGKGILKQDGLVIFCPFTTIGDHVRCRIVKRKQNYAEAVLVSVITPSPERIKPRCPYFGTCGGCQLQHMTPAAQWEYKKNAIESAFQRIGKFHDFKLDVMHPSSEPWEYRRKVQLHLHWTPLGYSMGYIATDNKSLVEVRVCPIFISEQNKLLNDLQDSIKSLQHSVEGRLSILKISEDSFHLSFHFPLPPKNFDAWIKEVISSIPNIKSASIHTPRLEKNYGPAAFDIQIANFSYRIPHNIFIQNHPEESLKIYNEIQKGVQASPKGRVLDLYCGIGVTSLLLAPYSSEVLGIEIDAQAVKCAQENAFSNVHFLAEDVEKALPSLKDPFDTVLVNPPRTGLTKKVIEELLRLRPSKIFYTSCMPPTMARDIQLLCQEGYGIASCQGFDMFPQTAHVEVLCMLTADERHI